MSNVVDDLGSNEIEWTLSLEEEITDWIELNHRMDSESSPLLPLSRVEKIVDAMLPRDDEWLLHVHIEESHKGREDLYFKLGRHVRSHQLRYPYNTKPTSHDLLHDNCRLYEDIAYGLSAEAVDGKIIKFSPSQYPAEILEASLNGPLSTVTGIMHVAWLECQATSWLGCQATPWLECQATPWLECQATSWLECQVGSGDGNEVPWYLVRWNDMLEMTGSSDGMDKRYLSDVNPYFSETLGDLLMGSYDDARLDMTDRILSYLNCTPEQEPNHAMIYRLPRTTMEEIHNRMFLAGVPFQSRCEQRCQRTTIKYSKEQLNVSIPNPRLYIERLSVHYSTKNYGWINRLCSPHSKKSLNELMSLEGPKNMTCDILTVIHIIIDLVAIDLELYRSNTSHLVTINPQKYYLFWKRIDVSLGSEFISALLGSTLRWRQGAGPVWSDSHLDQLIKEGELVVSESKTPKFTSWPILSKRRWLSV